MRVLVTGAAGQLGRWIVKELRNREYEIKALDRKGFPKEPQFDGVETIYADIADPLSVISAAAGCDAIIHTAAYTSPHNAQPAELMRVNVIGTQNILEAAMAHGIKKTIITSSVGALGFSFPKHPCLPDFLPVTIDHPCRPQDIYGLSKLMNEESALAATRLSGITTIVIRPPYIANLPEDLARPWFTHIIARHTDSYHSSLWSYIDVRDLARAYRMALESDIEGYNAFHVMADDVWAESDAADLIHRHLPDCEKHIPSLTGASLYDLKLTEDKIGFKPRLKWRDIQANGFTEADD